MGRILAVSLALAAILASGIVQGVWTDRWGVSNEPAASAARLAQVPTAIGSWIGEEQTPLSNRDLAIGEISGFLTRTYSSGQAKLSVLILCGRPGPISVHTPDVCFVGSGQDLVSKKTQAFTIDDGPPQEFTIGNFRTSEADGTSHSRAFWAWSANGDWSSPRYPRFAFAGKNALYKLYIVRSMARADEPIAEDPVLDFLKVFVPQLRKTLFGLSNES
jgi:Protein of unknown function (DUF3485)